MKNLRKLFWVSYLFLLLTSCLSVGPGSLVNSIDVPVGQTNVKYKLPRGLCLDKNAKSSTSLKETRVVTNCIEVINGNKQYYSRRPVDMIASITFTDLNAPKKVSQQKYLSVIAEKMEFKKFLIASSNKKLIYGEQKLQKNFFYVNFRRDSSTRTEYVRKYFFFFDNKMVVMTVLSFQKPTKSTYSSFEKFIKTLTESNS